jgi:hypothetical protein
VSVFGNKIDAKSGDMVSIEEELACRIQRMRFPHTTGDRHIIPSNMQTAKTADQRDVSKHKLNSPGKAMVM